MTESDNRIIITSDKRLTKSYGCLSPGLIQSLINRSITPAGKYYGYGNNNGMTVAVFPQTRGFSQRQKVSEYMTGDRYPDRNEGLSFINSQAGNAVEQQFLEYYNRELTFMREMALEFAAKHPHIAGRLGIEGAGIADPYVERMIEAFCFLSARTQIKLDTGFPEFTQRLLDILCPEFTAPTPSMGIVQLTPDLQAGDLSRGYTVPRHTAIRSKLLPGHNIRCEFRNSQPVTLWPLTLSAASLSTLPATLETLSAGPVDISDCKGALRLRLELAGEQTFSAIEGPDNLPFYIQGDEHIVSQLFELIHRQCVALCVIGGDSQQPTMMAGREALCFEGLSAEQSLLPVRWNMFHGHHLLQEYFCFRQRFYFFTLRQLAHGLKNIHSNQADIIILLKELPQHLIAHVNASRFLLYCTPVINLFPKQLDQTVIDRAKNSFHLVPDRCNPMEYEVFSVESVSGMDGNHRPEMMFKPLYQTRHNSPGPGGRYFSLQRKPTLQPTGGHSPVSQYQGTELFISLVDQHDAPYCDDLRYLRVEAMVTNRDWPRQLTSDATCGLTMPEGVPVSAARFVIPVTAPRPPLATGESAWQLIRQLSLNYLPFTGVTAPAGAEALRELLHLYTRGDDPQAATQINSLTGCRTEAVTRRLKGDGLLNYGRGVRCTLTIDEQGFSGCSPWLFGLVMENYLSRHAAINVFTETWLWSVQRGCIGQWPARPGKRGIL